MKHRAAILCLAALAATPAPARAQQIALSAELAADPQRRGPPALVWLRQEILPELGTWPAGLDPLGALRIEIADRELRSARGELAADGVCMRATLRIAGIGTLRGEGGFDGLERWTGEDLALPASRIRNLVALTSLLHHAGPVTLDTASFAGSLWSSAAGSSPLELLLTMGPAECGPVTFTFARSDARIDIVGRSDGGLLLPAALALVGDLAARPPQQGNLLAPREMDAAEAWRTLAAAARDGDREEAARQLSQNRDPRNRDMLERLLHADDYTRVVAMESLIRAGAVGTLPRLLEAADPARPDTEQLTELALTTLLPQASDTERQRWLKLAESHRSARVRATARRYRAQTASVAAAADAAGFDVRWSPLRIGALAFFLCSTALLGWLVIGHRRREPV
jgi:hypothetical protein